MYCSVRRLAAACAIMLVAATPGRAATDAELCRSAIKAAETASRLPPLLLTSIGIVESGRPDPASGRVGAWPWTINVEGTGHFFESKEQAIAAVREAQALGKSSIDVGCMQINLLHHPNAFATLEMAFDPATNARYAAGFLQRLFAQLGNWGAATGAYHSQTPDLGAAYRDKVAAIWPLGERYALVAPAPRGSSIPQDRMPVFRSLVAEQAADHARWVAQGLVPRPARAPGRRPEQDRIRLTNLIR